MTKCSRNYAVVHKTVFFLIVVFAVFFSFTASAQEQKTNGIEEYCPISIPIEDRRVLHITSINTTIVDETILRIWVNFSWENPFFTDEGGIQYHYGKKDEVVVNVYIDWNGDKEFTFVDEKQPSDSLKLRMDNVISNSDNVFNEFKKYGSGTVEGRVTIPDGAVINTWMRVSAADGRMEPCDSDDNVGDMQDFPLNLDPSRPEITWIWVHGKHSYSDEDITLLLTDDIGIPGVDEEIELKPEYDERRGYEITKFEWYGEFPDGEGNPYKFAMPAGKHGNQKFNCRMTYKNIESGDVGVDEVNHFAMDVFFDKEGDDNADEIPNWFTYWTRDGAVQGLSEVRYNKDLPGYAAAWYDDPNIEFGPHAAGWAGPTFTLNTAFGLETFNGEHITGIDYTASVIAHEKSHKWVRDQWKAPAGLFVGSIDSDRGTCAGCNDRLPDWYEREILLTDTSNTDTYDLGKLIANINHLIGDNEYRSMRAENEPGVKGVPSKDWAFPGKQSGENFRREGDIQQRRTDGPLLAIGEFSGIISEEVVDTNNNGLFEQLLVTTEINVSNPGRFIVAGSVKDSTDTRITSYNHLYDLDSGSHELTLAFDGFLINAHDVDGPYNVDIFMNSDLLHIDSFSLKQQLYTTNNYLHTDFEHYGAHFTNSILASTEDTDSDGQFDSLVFDIGIDAVDAAQFKIKASLFDDDDNVIQSIKTYRGLSIGSNSVRLAFDGVKITENRKNGPFQLRYLSVEKGNEFADFILDAYTTDTYNIADFEKEEAYFNGSLNGYGLDIDSAGNYEYLVYDIGMKVQTAGYYKIFGTLCDTGGTNIVRSSRWLNLPEGDTIYPLYFEGDSIFAHGVDGPYNLKSLFILDQEGDILDQINIAEATDAYQYTEFGFSQEPLLKILGNYSDKLINTDTNCMAEGISISFDLITYDTGWVFIKARLEDQMGEEIVWLEHYENFNAINTPKTVTIDIGADLLNNHGEDGPYVLKHVFAHMALNQRPSEFESPAYMTDNYSLSNFDSLDGTINYTARTICQGESFEFVDSVFTKSTTYTINLKNQEGCDSTVQLNLTVTDLPNINIGPDVVITVLDTFTLDAGTGSSFDWNTGDTTQTISVFGSQGMGDYTYSVIVLNDNFCEGKDSINVSIVGLTNSTINQLEVSNIILFPNPTNGVLNVAMDYLTAAMTIEIYAENGQVIYSNNFNTTNGQIVEQIDLSDHPSGIYFLSATTEGKTEVSKFVLNKRE